MKRKAKPAPVDEAPALWDQLTTLIQEYADAQEVDSWKGGGDPDYVEVKEAMLVLARAKLNAHISELRRYYHDDE